MGEGLGFCMLRSRDRIGRTHQWGGSYSLSFINTLVPFPALDHPSIMDLASTCSSFQSDLDFCPDCGSVLPLPGAQDTVACTRCGFSINVRGEGLVRSGPGRGPSVEGSEALGPHDRLD